MAAILSQPQCIHLIPLGCCNTMYYMYFCLTNIIIPIMNRIFNGPLICIRVSPVSGETVVALKQVLGPCNRVFGVVIIACWNTNIRLTGTLLSIRDHHETTKCFAIRAFLTIKLLLNWFWLGTYVFLYIINKAVYIILGMASNER